MTPKKTEPKIKSSDKSEENKIQKNILNSELPDEELEKAAGGCGTSTMTPDVR
jgi:hypothetical protein